MNLKRTLGIILSIAGVGAFIYALVIQEDYEHYARHAYAGDTSAWTVLIVGSIVVSLIGVLLLILGRNK